MLFFYKKNNEAAPATITNDMDIITCIANFLAPNKKAIHHLTAVLTITAMMIAMVAVLSESSLRDETESVIASTSVNHEKNATKYKLSAGR